MFGRRKRRKAREEDLAASYEDTKNNMMSSAEERIMASKKFGEDQGTDDFLDKLAAPQEREALLRATRPEKSNIKMTEFTGQKFQDPMDKSYQYQLLDTGDYAVFRNGKRTGTAKKDSYAFDSIANVQRGLDALPLLNQE